MNILVVHGPNLNLLGESKKDPVSYAQLNAKLAAFAQTLGVSLKVVQSNHEGVLLDSIQSERGWAKAILINPAALTHTSYALRECLRVVGLPTIEVHLEDIRRRETWRRKSVMKDVCEAQVMGKGLASYLDGLERLATGAYGGVRKGKSKVAAAEKAPLAPVAKPAPTATPVAPSPPPVVKAPLGPAPRATVSPPKTLGRNGTPLASPARLLHESAQTPPHHPAAKTLGRAVAAQTETLQRRSPVGLTRAEVRSRIAARLGNKTTTSALAAWAREQWTNVERGGAVEVGQREVLDEALQTLALSATPAGQLSDTDLIDLMARLE